MAGPLAGIRIVDFSQVISGPLSAALLADLGADVIKVEPPGSGDRERMVGSSRGGISGHFHMLNRGKRAMAVNVREAAGLEIALELCDRADVVIQNFRPGVAERLGLGYEALRVRNPRLIYLSISGFGAQGPLRDNKAYDPIIQSYAGVAFAEGRHGAQEPTFVNHLVGDKVTALNGAQAVLAALFHRERSGAGQHMELAMIDAAAAFMWVDAGIHAMLMGDDVVHRPPISTPGRIFKFKDGFGCAFAWTNEEFGAMCRALGGEDMAQDPRFSTGADRAQNREALTEAFDGLQATAAGIPLDEAVARFAEAQVPFGRVNAAETLPDDPQFIANEMFVDTVHPHAGAMREPRPPTVMHGSPTAPGGPAPLHGEHTREVLRELDYAESEIETLIQSAIVAEADL